MLSPKTEEPETTTPEHLLAVIKKQTVKEKGPINNNEDLRMAGTLPDSDELTELKIKYSNLVDKNAELTAKLAEFEEAEAQVQDFMEKDQDAVNSLIEMNKKYEPAAIKAGLVPIKVTLTKTSTADFTDEGQALLDALLRRRCIETLPGDLLSDDGQWIIKMLDTKQARLLPATINQYTVKGIGELKPDEEVSDDEDTVYQLEYTYFAPYENTDPTFMTAEEFYDSFETFLSPMSKEQFQDKFDAIMVDHCTGSSDPSPVVITPEDCGLHWTFSISQMYFKRLVNPEFTSLTAKCPLTNEPRWVAMGISHLCWECGKAYFQKEDWIGELEQYGLLDQYDQIDDHYFIDYDPEKGNCLCSDCIPSEFLKDSSDEEDYECYCCECGDALLRPDPAMTDAQFRAWFVEAPSTETCCEGCRPVDDDTGL